MQARRYAVLGVLAGLGLPLASTFVSAWVHAGSVLPQALWRAHLSDPVLWIVDTAPLVLGALGWIIGRQHGVLAREHEENVRAERNRRDAFERAGADVTKRSRALLSSVASFTASTAETAVSVRETTATMAQLSKTAMAAALTAESVIGLAAQSEKAAAEGMATAEASSGALKDLAGEIRGLARRVASLNDRMRELFDLVVELEREPSRAADLAARGRAILGHVHREMHGFVAATEADAVRAEEGARVVHRAAETVRALAGTLAESAGAARRIAEVAQQQEGAFEQVMNAMNEIYLASEETASSTREVAEEAQALAELAARFRGAVRPETPE